MDSTTSLVPGAVPFGTMGALQSHQNLMRDAGGLPVPEAVVPQALEVGAERSLKAIVDRGNMIQEAKGTMEASQIEVRTDLPFEGQVISHLTNLDNKGLGKNVDVSI